MKACEVCGTPIHGQPLVAKIEGGVFTVCPSCAKLGTPIRQAKGVEKPPHPLRAPPPPSLEVEELELRADFPQVIKQAREKAGLSQEEMGRRINEKPSVIRLLESGRLKPDNLLARKVERFLKVELLLPEEEDKAGL